MTDITLSKEHYKNIKDIIISLCSSVESLLENDISFLCDDHPELYTCLTELSDLYESSTFKDSLDAWNDITEDVG